VIGELKELFKDTELVEKIKRKLPYMFFLAELEMSKGGRVGMEVGTIREQIIVALLIHKFGRDNIGIPNINSADFDLQLFGKPLSIKTVSKRIPRKIQRLSGSGIKLIWTVDWEKVEEFVKNYSPNSELILIEVVWGETGGFYYIPLEVQHEIFNDLKGEYLYKHRKGTNPRGVEISNKALKKLIDHKETLCIQIRWEKPEVEGLIYKPYERWIELWEKD